MMRCSACILFFFSLGLPQLGAAQVEAERAYLDPLRTASTIVPVAKDYFGDQVNLKDGSTEFLMTDVDLPGNSKLPVRFQRARSIHTSLMTDEGVTDHATFGQVDVPYLKGTFEVSDGWKVDDANPYNRCSSGKVRPRSFAQIQSWEYWGGSSLHVPGESNQALLSNTGTLIPVSFPLVTKGNWKFQCLQSTKNGYPGEAFVGISPSGIKYYFDWVLSVGVPRYSKLYGNYGATTSISRVAVYFLVSRVEDRFGNWVNYDYVSNHLSKIYANDGRAITINWTGNSVTSVSSPKGTISYGANSIVLPDGSQWQYQDNGAAEIEQLPDLPYSNAGNPPRCPTPSFPIASDETISITAPSGAKATYLFSLVRHYRTNLPKTCNQFLVAVPGGDQGLGGGATTVEFLTLPNFYDAYTLVKKTISGPGIPDAVWTYKYEVGARAILSFLDQCGTITNPTCPTSVDTIIHGPDNKYEKYSFGTWVDENEGFMLGKEVGTETTTSSGTSYSPLSRVRNEYFNSVDVAGQGFPADAGSGGSAMTRLSDSSIRPLRATTTYQDGIAFDWRVNQDCNNVYCFDVFARPTKVTKSSTLSP